MNTGKDRFPESLRRGLSLVEIVVSTLIVGGMVVTALNTLGGAYKTRKVNATRLTTPGLAHELLTEILSMPYEDPEDGNAVFGRESDELGINRADFDDVDDYHLWAEAGIKTKDGMTVNGYEDWNRSCSVEWIAPSVMGTVSLSDQGLKRITVTATDPEGKNYTIVALRYQKGVLEQPVESNTTAVTWVGVEISADKGVRATRHGINLKNLATDDTAP